MDSSPPDLGRLSGDAQIFARAILATHPEWTSGARVERSADSWSFVVEVRAPDAAAPSVFVYADEDEITVAFDRWHAHYDTWAERPDEEGPTDARAVVEALLAEQLAVAVMLRGSEWLESRIVRAGEAPQTPPAGARVYVRSWAGTLNSELAAV